MKLWETIIRSYNIKTNEVEIFQGETIEAISPRLAQKLCNETGRGYLVVTGQEMIGEVNELGKFTDFRKKHNLN